MATEEKSIQGIALWLLKGFNEDELKAMKANLIEITEDGVYQPGRTPKTERNPQKAEKNG